MEIGFTPFAAQLRGATRFDDAGLDWHALRTRFAAAHAARAALAPPKSSADGASGGSFAPRAAGELAQTRESLHTVNLTDLADRKSHGGMAMELAGTATPGERGMQ